MLVLLKFYLKTLSTWENGKIKYSQILFQTVYPMSNQNLPTMLGTLLFVLLRGPVFHSFFKKDTSFVFSLFSIYFISLFYASAYADRNVTM